MSFASGSVSFTRYRLKGPKPRQFDDAHLGRLRDHARPRVEATGPEVGWGAGDSIFDVDFGLEKNVFPDHLLWDLWVKARPLPADRLRAYYTTDLKALARDNPSGLPSARQKREAMEGARQRLGEEAKDGRYDRWTLAPVAWDLVRNEVLVGTASAAQLGRFEGLFAATFGADLTQAPRLAGDLQPVDAGALALAHDKTAKHAGLSEYVKGQTADLDGRPAWVRDEGNVSFLGNEWALWLWHRLDVDDTVRVADGSEITAMLSGGVKLDCPRGQTGSDTLNHPGPARMAEARAGLKVGKLPRKLGLTLVSKAEQFAFHVQPETFAVSAGKLPPPPADTAGRRDVVAHRLQAVRDLCEAVEALYAAFLDVRLSPQWGDELARVKRWVAAAGKAGVS